MSRVTVGSFEVVSLPAFDLCDVIAKIDTGAYSGAIHCTNIRVVKNGDVQTLHFKIDGRPYSTTQYRRRIVRGATGHQVKRYVVHTEIIVQGKTYDVSIGISDRTSLTFPVLIGRKFLRQQDMLVDVTQNIEHDPEGALE
jgi:hypothetical protein